MDEKHCTSNNPLCATFVFLLVVFLDRTLDILSV